MFFRTKRLNEAGVFHAAPARAAFYTPLLFLLLGAGIWSVFRNDAAYTAAAAFLDRGVPSSPRLAMSAEWLVRQSFAKQIIVSEKARLIYCPIPKAASSNWKYLIRKFEGFDNYTNLRLNHSPELSGLKFLADYSAQRASELLADPKIFKFVFVRDPTARSVSCYMNKFNNTKQPDDEKRVFLAGLYNWTYASKIDLKHHTAPTFRQFVTQIEKQEPEDMDGHWRPQTRLCGFGALKYDFVGRMETVQKDAAYVLRRLGRDAEEFPTQKKIGFLPSGAKKNYSIAPDLRKKLVHIYREDFSNGLGAPSREKKPTRII